KIIVSDPRTKVGHREGLFETEHDLIRDNAEFGSYRIRHLTGDEADRDPERMPGSQSARNHVQRIGELLAESGDPAPARPCQEQKDRSGRERTRKRDCKKA